MTHTNSWFIRWVGIGNLLNLVLFQLLFIVAWMLRPGYSPIRQPASDLGIGPYGAWVDAGVVVLALLKISLAIAFFIAMRPILSVAWRWICAILIALPGVGNIVTAVFTEAPATLMIHSLASAVVVLVCLITLLLVGALLWRTPGWQGFGVFSVLAGVVFMALAILLYLTFAPTSPLSALHIGGLSERVVIFERDFWYAVVGWHLYKQASGAGVHPLNQRGRPLSERRESTVGWTC